MATQIFLASGFEVALANTLLKAMKRGDVKTDAKKRYVVVSPGDTSQSINSETVNDWRKLAAIPLKDTETEGHRQKLVAQATS